tara:strand:- start:15772 stop:16872 length:1101 start_codon:yes stop_codon:yes gene_type:complete
MDTTDSKITFDENGVCDHCNTFFKDIEPVWNYGKGRERELEKLVDDIKKEGKNKDFDCLMGVSGGIDSSYLLYKMAHDYGLRPLVFHVDAGWNTQISVNNIEKLIDGLGLDLYTEVINWEEIRDLQLAFFKSGVPHIDVPQDHVYFSTMYKFAHKHGIKYILTGGNFSTECVRNPIEWMYYQSDYIQLKDIYKKHGTGKLKSYPINNVLLSKIYLPFIKGIKIYRPLDYLKYYKDEAIKLLEEKFGFQTYPQKHFESRFTRFYESYWLPERFGFDTRKVQFSSLILTGQMTREEALDELKEPAYDPETISHELEYVANKLRIPVDELNQYFSMPKKTYKDYRSIEGVYNIGAIVMRFFGMERGGKR